MLRFRVTKTTDTFIRYDRLVIAMVLVDDDSLLWSNICLYLLFMPPGSWHWLNMVFSVSSNVFSKKLILECTGEGCPKSVGASWQSDLTPLNSTALPSTLLQLNWTKQLFGCNAFYFTLFKLLHKCMISLFLWTRLMHCYRQCYNGLCALPGNAN